MYITPRFAIPIVLAIFCSHSALGQKAEWPWRGPTNNGIAEQGQTPPTEWSDTKNVVWKTKVPGRGHSSPIIAGDKIFLTTADESAKTQSVLCYELDSGKALWAETIHRGKFNPRIHQKNTHASPSIACDGNHIVAVFNNDSSVMVTAMELDGKKLWTKKAATYKSKYPFGFAPSPIIDGDTVLVTFEGSNDAAIVRYDTKTGEEVSRIKRDRSSSYSTPVIANIDSAKHLLISGGMKVSSYDLSSEKLEWEAKTAWQVSCGTLVWDNENKIVFASGGFPRPQTLAIDAKSGKTLWSNRTKSYEQSMLVYKGFLYTLTDNGIAYCWDAKTGDEMWKSRLSSPVSASPVVANDHIYFSDEKGTTYVINATSEKFDLVATNRLGNVSFATPAFVNDRIITRVAQGKQGWLYSLGE